MKTQDSEPDEDTEAESATLEDAMDQRAETAPDGEDPAAKVLRLTRRLSGILKEEYAVYGGGEAYLKWVRGEYTPPVQFTFREGWAENLPRCKKDIQLTIRPCFLVEACARGRSIRKAVQRARQR